MNLKNDGFSLRVKINKFIIIEDKRFKKYRFCFAIRMENQKFFFSYLAYLYIYKLVIFF